MLTKKRLSFANEVSLLPRKSPKTRWIAPKAWLQRVVVATSFPPFVQAYRAYYRLATFLVVRFFRGDPRVKAVYLRRGCARGQIRPGVSDINFDVIVEEMDKSDRLMLRRRYEKVARFLIVPDHEIGICDEQMFRQRARWLR